MNTTYRVRFKAQSAVQLARPLMVGTKTGKALVTNNISTASGTVQHRGLLYDVDLPSSSAVKAIREAGAGLEAISNVIAVATGAAIRDPVPLISFDVDGSKPDRDFAQVLAVPSNYLPLRKAVAHQFNSIMPRWGEILRTPKLAKSINRSMQHIRRSFDAIDLVDEFGELWTALEAINGMLQEKYTLPKKAKTGTCPHCGKSIENLLTNSGIKYALLMSGAPESAWKNIRASRQVLAHGVSPSPEIEAEWPQNLSLLRKAAHYAVLDCIGLKKEEIEDLLSNRIQLDVQYSVVLTAELESIPVESMLNSNPIPHFELKGVEELFPVRDNEYIHNQPIAAQLILVRKGIVTWRDLKAEQWKQPLREQQNSIVQFLTLVENGNSFNG